MHPFIKWILSVVYQARGWRSFWTWGPVFDQKVHNTCALTSYSTGARRVDRLNTLCRNRFQTGWSIANTKSNWKTTYDTMIYMSPGYKIDFGMYVRVIIFVYFAFFGGALMCHIYWVFRKNDSPYSTCVLCTPAAGISHVLTLFSMTTWSKVSYIGRR